MERILYLNERFAAVAENGRLVEYMPIRAEEETGAILRGRVERIMGAMQCAFVDIGRKKSGFLPLKENSQTFQGGLLQSGEEVLVQIRKEERDGKGAFLSRDLNLAGSGLLLMPMNRFIGVSARVKEEAARTRLKELGKTLLAEQKMPCGIVMRAAALQLNPEALRAERDQLWEGWQRALERSKAQPEARVVLEGFSAAEELLKDYGPRGIDRIERGETLPADLARQLKEAANRTIRLPHGGNIVIDPCEAMTVIDVNSASDAGGSRRETILETNLEACRELAVQTRLRNLSGILILDLIDMEEKEDQERVLRELEACFREDRIKTVIHGLTRLGLVEMTRKRGRGALAAGSGLENGQ